MKNDKPIRGDEPFPIPYRDPGAVERIVGKIRRAVQVGTGFYAWPLWQRYPTWHQYNQQLADEREAAEKAGRAPHPAAAPPKRAQTMQTEEWARRAERLGGLVKRAPKA